MGLVQLVNDSFTSVSSINYDNVFSSTYRNYLLYVSFDPSTATTLYLRMRTGGTTDTSTNYDWQEASIYATSVDLGQTSNTTFMNVGASGDNSPIYPGASVIELSRPFLAANTTFSSHFYRDFGTALLGFMSGRHEVASSQDGFTLSVNNGTMTGTLRVYGYETV